MSDSDAIVKDKELLRALKEHVSVRLKIEQFPSNRVQSAQAFITVQLLWDDEEVIARDENVLDLGRKL